MRPASARGSWLSSRRQTLRLSRTLKVAGLTRPNCYKLTAHTSRTSGEASMATFVLVHGGWHGGWCWEKVIPFLEAAGHQVYAPTLTGLAERASELSPDVGLDTHIQDVVGLLVDKDLHGVILVGHSYGGMVITGVVDAVPERIAHLVYLDTFVPRDGEAMVDVSPRLIRLLLRRQTRADGWRVDSQGTYGVTTEPDRSWVLSKVTPQ